MQNYREELIKLKNSPIEQVIATSPANRMRPLGLLSDFVCEELGTCNHRIRTGSLAPDQLFEMSEALAAGVPETLFSSFLADTNTNHRREAILDLVWLIRSLDIAYEESVDWKRRRNMSLLFHLTSLLCDQERRHPNLSWSDIALYHPIMDPRTFLEPGPNRDQEVLLYRVQYGIEHIFRCIIQSDFSHVTANKLVDIGADLNAVVDAVVHLSRVRSPGQFYDLDPFLGANNEYTGHGTGAFSAWTYLLGYFLAGNESYRQRVLKPENRLAFDRDADPVIERLRQGEFQTLTELIDAAALDSEHAGSCRELAQKAGVAFARFLRAHRGAMQKHSPNSFEVPAPADLVLDNQTAIDRAIKDMHDGKPVPEIKRRQDGREVKGIKLPTAPENGHN